ncbi:MarR family transcriptional regulator [Exiguobacterium indicum]|uniref:MarR family winged helix-turn-helix transcriptional regulator n=1 Tax=Exiguobacterium indicum TaxID=296995 RepID=UPI000736503A|nr:MarR family transcriptional regulator [Exiguobacterium indicum]KTR59738.1 MarR family transcriptional regulator [Exiguobacterium indicum]
MELTECINFLLSVSQNKVFKQFSNELDQYHVTPAQYGVLNCLWKHDTLAPRRIAEMLHLEPSTVSGILDKMQQADLIDRSVDVTNRRNVLVRCTQKAIALQTDIEATVAELNQSLTQHASREELDIVRQVLIGIIQQDNKMQDTSVAE